MLIFCIDQGVLKPAEAGAPATPSKDGKEGLHKDGKKKHPSSRRSVQKDRYPGFQKVKKIKILAVKPIRTATRTNRCFRFDDVDEPMLPFWRCG